MVDRFTALAHVMPQNPKIRGFFDLVRLLLCLLYVSLRFPIQRSVENCPVDCLFRFRPFRFVLKRMGVWGGRWCAVSFRLGVSCKSCRCPVEVEDEYIHGIRAAEMAAALYKSVGREFSDFRNFEWRKTKICGNPGCRKTHDYTVDDLLVYNG